MSQHDSLAQPPVLMLFSEGEKAFVHRTCGHCAALLAQKGMVRLVGEAHSVGMQLYEQLPGHTLEELRAAVRGAH